MFSSKYIFKARPDCIGSLLGGEDNKELLLHHLDTVRHRVLVAIQKVSMVIGSVILIVVFNSLVSHNNILAIEEFENIS